MKRLYESLIAQHFAQDRQMLFLMGPRQSGKTTTAKRAASLHADSTYLSWDHASDRKILAAGPEALAQRLGLERLRDEPPCCVLDEIHRYRRWKSFLKGFFDVYENQARLIVTGSARLDVFKAGGDSLMGRYFAYRHHPLSVAELLGPGVPSKAEVRNPRRLANSAFEALWRFGGFPEPLVRADTRFFNRWRRTRHQQLFKEDLRDLTRVQEIGQVEMLAELLRSRVGQLINYSSLARAISASVDSVRRWLKTLEALYFCFPVRPYSKNIARSLRKEPKYFLWDWSEVSDDGMRAENFIACALLKAVHLWTDLGFGAYELYFVRDKQKREVDFLVTRDARPWFLAEVKASASAGLSPALHVFQTQTAAPHAFQIAIDAPFVARDCFETSTPVIVPARTLLAQLV